MLRIGIPILLTAGIIWLSYAEVADALPRLPDKIASHFNAAGVVDGWTTKDQFFKIWSFAVLGLGGVFAIVTLFMMLAPAKSMNLPRRDYWMAPERAAIARRMMIVRMLWFVVGLMSFIAWVFHMIVEFNLQRGKHLEIAGPLAVYLVFAALWSGEMLWAFWRGGKASSSTPDGQKGDRLFPADGA